jgi:hypothetical protein
VLLAFWYCSLFKKKRPSGFSALFFLKKKRSVHKLLVGLSCFAKKEMSPYFLTSLAFWYCSLFKKKRPSGLCCFDKKKKCPPLLFHK